MVSKNSCQKKPMGCGIIHNANWSTHGMQVLSFNSFYSEG